MYPDPDVARLVSANFLPVRVHAREQAEDFARLGERFGAEWTPTVLMLDGEGVERHRIEGFLPKEDFMAQLRYGLGRIQFSDGNFEEAERRFKAIVDGQPESDVAPEAQYWAGVARYKHTGDAGALEETGRAFQTSYQDSPWAKKASVWVK